MAKRTAEGEPIIIKKYANRRLYNTDTSSYITLDDLAKMVRDNVDFQVLDAKSGTDITHTILTQIIVEEESHGTQMLPVSFLRDLISMYGNSMQSMMPSYLEASMANFRKNREQLQAAFAKGIESNPLAKMAEANFKMMQNAADVLIPGARKSPKPGQADELAQMRAQMAEMQKKLDELSK
ncbi:polyhydroxyalkanoate synthesis repressor PhaR [Qipengyuania psychrotolerans]|uniref:Polyhydroxyalkanoate synthesis repressor PhaR n=1 Tax=Qipengyuania psychrotolerans TaxID=2867238 RepID=A0ABX8ZH09_9SPHN|nr:polyhydroxyalkanoate synthesis repressor PhaR [Qipengyuania psychrotolerans]QZD88272.1 polyhydroxyalkanoate synthesis repressor PhaR [Qipengyuania psychrotolerans]